MLSANTQLSIWVSMLAFVFLTFTVEVFVRNKWNSAIPLFIDKGIKIEKSMKWIFVKLKVYIIKIRNKFKKNKVKKKQTVVLKNILMNLQLI